MQNPEHSLLSGEEIRAAGLVSNAQEHLYRASTYDFSAGAFIDSAGTITSTYCLRPGGMVRVVSHEAVSVPDGITGHVLLKNALCTKGVLALNIGVVDPGYIGPVSSTLINFGRSIVDINQGEPFLRISFHRCPSSPKSKKSAKWDELEYLRDIKLQVQAHSGPTFLNLDKATSVALENALGNLKANLIFWSTMIGLVFAF